MSYEPRLGGPYRSAQEVRQGGANNSGSSLTTVWRDDGDGG
eukprot:CAMPEP_0182525168 /NCGR_PEP_ID=MMETSP1323-20130603/2303_1 /TAXON_ID=236787 /ORGANISM="Florenciella parvula, Strain RCC1693" /LENGTH=40 /DNA_ID= /DNA_START= /DNA_END= /DNA_ORIENTATION=